MMDYSTLLKNRRSIRNYLPNPIPPEVISDIIKESCMAPNSTNGQPWGFVVITRKDLIKRLSDESKANILSEIEGNPGSRASRFEAKLRNDDFNVFYNAPCLVYIIGSRHLPSLHVDCALAASYFMFSAAARGLGTCWIGLGRHISSRSLLDEIGVSDDDCIVAPIIVGYPEHIPDMPTRNEPRIIRIIS